MVTRPRRVMKQLAMFECDIGVYLIVYYKGIVNNVSLNTVFLQICFDPSPHSPDS